MQLLYLTFADSQRDPLAVLTEECDKVNTLLARREKERHYRLSSDANASLAKIADQLLLNQSDLVLFHYAGHAGRDRLLLREEAANAEGIARLLGRCPKLRLVVLNGCSTRGQVDELLRQGVPAVIATSAPVGDRAATQFAISFYQAMAENKKSIREAFVDGIAAAQAQSRKPLKEEVDLQARSISLDEDGDQPLWGLYCRQESDSDWTLPKAVAQKLNSIPGVAAGEVVGRAEDLAQLKARLASSASLLLMNGIGGIGKTTLAKLYASQHGDQYDRIAWVEQRDSLVQSFATDAGLQASLGIRQEQGETFEQVCYRMLLALQNMDGTNLLVVDNADQGLREWSEQLPQGKNWHVLLTSRQVIGSCERMELGKLGPDAARELFLKHCTKPQDVGALDAFLEKIEYHTLSIELFAKLLEAHREMDTVGELSNYLDTHQLDDETLQAVVDLEHARGETTRYRHLLQAFDLSGIDQRPELLRLLKQMAALPPGAEGYPARDLMEWCGIEKDKTTFANHLQELHRLGWLLQPQKNHFGCHRLLKAIVNQTRPADKEDLMPLVEAFAEKLSFDESKDNPADKIEWIPSGQSLLRSAEHLEFNEKAALQNNLAMVLKHLGDYAGAKALLEKALQSHERNFGPEHPTTAVTYSNLALILRALGDYDGAKGLLEKALQSDLQHFGPDHPNTAVRYSNLAIVLMDLWDYAGAKVLLEKALQSDERNFGPYHPTMAARYSNLAIVLRDLGDYAGAKVLLEKALQADERNFGPDPPNAAWYNATLGSILQELGDYAGAKVFMEKALQSDERNLGRDHPDTAVSYSNLGAILAGLGDYENARKLISEAYAIFRNQLGEGHPNTQAARGLLKQLDEMEGSKG